MALKIPTKEKAIKYAKVIAIIGISLFVVSLIRKQIRRKGLLRGFGNFKTITKDDRGNERCGNVAGYDLECLRQLITSRKRRGAYILQ